MLPSEKGNWELHSGIDLEKGADVVAEKLKAIDGIERTNYVYFTCTDVSLIVSQDYQTLTGWFCSIHCSRQRLSNA